MATAIEISFGESNSSRERLCAVSSVAVTIAIVAIARSTVRSGRARSHISAFSRSLGRCRERVHHGLGAGEHGRRWNTQSISCTSFSLSLSLSYSIISGAIAIARPAERGSTACLYAIAPLQPSNTHFISEFPLNNG